MWQAVMKRPATRFAAPILTVKYTRRASGLLPYYRPNVFARDLIPEHWVALTDTDGDQVALGIRAATPADDPRIVRTFHYSNAAPPPGFTVAEWPLSEHNAHYRLVPEDGGVIRLESVTADTLPVAEATLV